MTTPELAAPPAADRPLILLNSQYLTSSVDWRRGDVRTSPFRTATFVEQALRAETAGVDAIFQADFSGVNRTALRSGPPLTVFEPFQLSALVADATSRIAVMPTVSTLHTHPVSFARSLASLDRLSGGRAWVNVVSSFRPGTALGSTRTVGPDRRHDQTREFLDVSRRLWASWPPEANEPDPTTDRFIRDDLVRDLDHHGEFYDQPGPIDMPPLSRDFPFTLQPSSSAAGVRQVARTADGLFAGTPTRGAATALRSALRRESVTAGRAPDAVALLPGCYLHVTDRDDHGLAFAARQRRSRGYAGEAAVAELRARYPALALGDAAAGDPLPSDLLPRSSHEVLARHGTAYLPLWDLAREHDGSTADFADAVIALSEHVRFVGTPHQIAEEMSAWIRSGAVDGFQLILGDDFDAVCEEIVPAVVAATRPADAR